MRLKCYAKSNPKLKWIAYISSQEILLEQGELIELEAARIQEAPEVFVTVVDSHGNAVKGVPVQHWFDGYGVVMTEETDSQGQATFYSRNSYRKKFIVGKENTPQLKCELLYELKEGEKTKKLEMRVSSEVLDYIFR
jgi:hypothetical protein